MSDSPPPGFAPQPARPGDPPAVRFVQPYPGAPPVPVTGAPSSVGSPPRSAGLGIVAFCLTAGGVLGILGAFAADTPSLQWLAVPALVIGFVCGMAALIGRRHAGKGFSITAVTLASLAGFLASVALPALAAGGFGDPWEVNGSSADLDALHDGVPPSSAPVAEHVVVAESAFGADVLDPGTAWFAVVLDNPNRDVGFEADYLLVRAVDAEGAVIDTVSEYVAVPPGTTAIAGYLPHVGERAIARLDVDLPDPASAVEMSSALGITAHELRSLPREGLTTVTGSVTSTLHAAVPYARVTVLARGPEGAIIGAEDASLPEIPAAGTVPFEVAVFGALPADTAFEAYPRR
jgi:hypothetical protein